MQAGDKRHPWGLAFSDLPGARSEGGEPDIRNLPSAGVDTPRIGANALRLRMSRVWRRASGRFTILP